MINIIVFVLFSLLDVCNSESSVISAEDIISMKESAVDMDSIEGIVMMVLLGPFEGVAFNNWGCGI